MDNCCRSCQVEPGCDGCVKCPHCEYGWWLCRACSDRRAEETLEMRMKGLERDRAKYWQEVQRRTPSL